MCTRPTLGGTVNHAYFWSDKTDPHSCGMNACLWWGSGNDHDQAGNGPNGAKNDNCHAVAGSDGKDQELMKCCDDTANDGVIFPVLNDCHTKLKRCLKKSGLDWPEEYDGRFPSCGFF